MHRYEAPAHHLCATRLTARGSQGLKYQLFFSFFISRRGHSVLVTSHFMLRKNSVLYSWRSIQRPERMKSETPPHPTARRLRWNLLSTSLHHGTQQIKAFEMDNSPPFRLRTLLYFGSTIIPFHLHLCRTCTVLQSSSASLLTGSRHRHQYGPRETTRTRSPARSSSSCNIQMDSLGTLSSAYV